MSQMRRVEFPKIFLTATKMGEDGRPVLDDKDCPMRPHVPGPGDAACRCQLVKRPVKAQDLHLMALANAGTSAGYEGLRKHLPISAAVEKSEGGHVLLDEEQWTALTAALGNFKSWPWYHDDVLRVIDAAKDAERVDVEVKEQKGPNRKARRQARR